MSLFFTILFSTAVAYFIIGVAFIGPVGMLVAILHYFKLISTDFAGDAILGIFFLSIFPWIWLSGKFAQEICEEHVESSKRIRDRE